MRTCDHVMRTCDHVTRTCDDDIDGAAGVAGDIAGRARVLARCISVTLDQLDEVLVSLSTHLHLVSRLDQLAVLEPRHAHLSACTPKRTRK